MKDTGEIVPDHYQDECAFFRYNVVRLWEQDAADIMRHEGLLPLAVLCRTDTEPAQLLRAVAQQIREIAASDERREQIGATQILAGLRFPNSLIYQILKGTDMLEESTVYQDILQRGVQRGLQTGLEQGKKQMALDLVEERFGPPTPWVRRTIEAMPANLVSELGRRLLLDLKNTAELRAWLRAHSR